MNEMTGDLRTRARRMIERSWPELNELLMMGLAVITGYGVGEVDADNLPFPAPLLHDCVAVAFMGAASGGDKGEFYREYAEVLGAILAGKE